MMSYDDSFSSSEFFASTRIQESVEFPANTPLQDGRYVVKERLGRGGCSTVYCTYDRARCQYVALKFADAGACDIEVARKVLRHEYRMYAQVKRHPNVLDIYDMHLIRWQGRELLCVAMEAGETSFRSWLIRHKNDPNRRRSEGIEFFRQMCRGVSAFHHADIVHLDIKPENFVFVRGVLKLCDCGAARLLQSIDLSSGIQTPSFGYRIGTPTYMAPELLLSAHPEDVSKKADVYSLGCIAYELFHEKCHPPFSGSFEELRHRHLNCKAPRLVGVSERFANVVAICLEGI